MGQQQVDYDRLARRFNGQVVTPESQPAPKPPDLQEPMQRFVGGLASMLLPSTTPSDYLQGPLYALQNPIESLKLLAEAIGGAHKEQAGRAGEALQSAIRSERPRDKALETVRAVGHSVASVIPVLGPAAGAVGETIGTGDVAGGVGATAGLLAPFGAKRVPSPRVPGFGRTANPAEAAAIAFGESRGIPIDAATASGRQFVRNTQKRVGAQVGASGVAERAMDTQAGALSRVGGELADSVHPQSVTPVSAGEGVTKALIDKRLQFSREADAAYDRLRSLEAKAKPETRAPHPGAKLQSGKLWVDVRPAKRALRATYDAMVKEADLVAPQGDSAKALRALHRLMEAPDFAPLSIADAALGELKTAGRVAEGVMRSKGKGALAETIRTLDAQVISAAKKGGTDVVQALMEGRRATVEKYRTSLVTERVAGKDAGREPRAIYTSLTADRDGGIARLRQVAKQTPNEIPKIGRAMLEEMLTKAKSKGKFDHADALFAEWERLGPETKRTLFPTQADDLDKFFRLAAKIKENANPSGTAPVLANNLMNPMNWVTAIPNNILARALYSPGGVQKLLDGQRLTPEGAWYIAAKRSSVAAGRTQAGASR